MIEQDKAYAAGVMDSDGCFHILNRAGGRRMEAVVSVGMVYPDVLRWLQERWGGSTNKTKNGSWGFKYQWRIYGSDLDRFLVDVSPYLILKDNRCSLLMDFRSTIGVPGRHLSASVISTREKIHGDLKILNSPASF